VGADQAATPTGERTPSSSIVRSRAHPSSQAHAAGGEHAAGAGREPRQSSTLRPAQPWEPVADRRASAVAAAEKPPAAAVLIHDAKAAADGKRLCLAATDPLP
jgi:hypothetical protein